MSCCDGWDGVVQCVQVLGQWLGVCRDAVVGGVDSNQVFTARRERGLTVLSYRRTLQPGTVPCTCSNCSLYTLYTLDTSLNSTDVALCTNHLQSL